MTYNTPTAHFKSSAEIINFPTAARTREWWLRQSQIDGTTWESLGRAAARALWRAGLASSLCWESSS